MITWMLWSTGFVALLCVAAFASERVAGVFGVARRQVWMVALVAGAVLPPILATQSITPPEPQMVLMEEFPAGPVSATGAPRTFVRPPIVRENAPLRSAHAPADQSGFDRIAIIAWALASLTLAVVFARTMAALRRNAAGWPEVEIGQYRALLAPDAGPAVIGFARPRIVVPHWALSLDDAMRDLMLRHEAEHIRASDPRTLFAAGALLVVFPWNAALWFIVRQLRRAMELDCDARVIRAVGSPTEYGRVLLAVGERFTASLPLAASLSAPRPLLEQRIDVMTSPRPRHPMRVALPFVAGALIIVTTAALAPHPAPLKPISFAPRTAPPAATSVTTHTPPKSGLDLAGGMHLALNDAPKRTAVESVGPPPEAARVKARPPKPEIGRDEVIAIANARFPAVVSGDVPAKFLVMVFDTNDRYLWGFPATSGVMVRVNSDTLTAQQRRALQVAQGAAGVTGGASGRGGRGGGSVAPPGSAGGANASFNASGTLSPSRGSMYITTYGMTATRDSAGVFHPGPINQGEGLVTVTPNGGESGIDGVPAMNVVYVDQFQLRPDAEFSKRVEILAVHLNDVRADTAPDGWVRVSTLIANANDTGQVAEKKKAKVKQLVVLPMPAPPGYTMRACYDVASDGKARLIDWTKSRDSTYNRKILESLNGYLFTPATLNGVAVRDTACINATHAKNGG